MLRGAALLPGRRGIKPHGELNRARVPLLWGFNALQGLADLRFSAHPRNHKESTVSRHWQGASFSIVPLPHFGHSRTDSPLAAASPTTTSSSSGLGPFNNSRHRSTIPFVRVISAKVPPGKTEPKHRHPRGVTVYLADYEIEQTTFPSGQKNRSVRRFGTVSWSEPLVHEVRNIGKTGMHSIRIELK